MNSQHASESELPALLSQDDLRSIDLLVDGELEPAVQKQLLSKIDAVSRADIDEPWRQVALAYVESQAWRSDFRSLGCVDTPAAATQTSVPVALVSRTARGSSAGLTRALLAMAACLAVAFGLGYYMAGGDQAADIAADADSVADKSVATADIEPIMVPIFVNNTNADPFGNPHDPVMPQHLIEALERAGQPMQPDRTLVPIQMEDGTEISLPVADLKLRLEETSRRVNSLREKLELVSDESAE